MGGGRTRHKRLHRAAETWFASCRSARVGLDREGTCGSTGRQTWEVGNMGPMWPGSHPVPVMTMAGTEEHDGNRLGNLCRNQKIESLKFLAKVEAES